MQDDENLLRIARAANQLAEAIELAGLGELRAVYLSRGGGLRLGAMHPQPFIHFEHADRSPDYVTTISGVRFCRDRN